jgi:hypothetical protein
MFYEQKAHEQKHHTIPPYEKKSNADDINLLLKAGVFDSNLL